MRDFDEDYLSGHNNPSFDTSFKNKQLSDLKIKNKMKRSAFHFETFEEFINDPKVIKAFGWIIAVAITLPILCKLILYLYRKMFTDNIKKVSFDDSQILKNDVSSDEETIDSYEDESKKDLENVKPFNDINLTDEDKILMGATIDADEHGFDMAEALNRIELHGKLATAQLRHKTQEIENEMTEEEREQERRIRNEQLAKIFAMMETNSEKFGIQTEEELREQMKLYSI